MLFQAIIGVSLETLVDLCIGSLNLTIALWVSNKRIADLDAKVFAIPLEGTAGKLVLFGTPNLHMIELMNLTASWLLILTTGVAFGHLVNLSMAT
jgi:hypothetical protein